MKYDKMFLYYKVSLAVYRADSDPSGRSGPTNLSLIDGLTGFIGNIQMPTWEFFTREYGEYFCRTSVQFFNAICQRPSGKSTLLIFSCFCLFGVYERTLKHI